MKDQFVSVLIVDDSALVRQVVRRTLGMTDLPVHEVLEAPNGREALALLRGHRVDLVLADLHMPEMSGVEMTRVIQSDPATRGIPVIVVSADPSAERIDGLAHLGVRACVRKPFTPEAIRDVVTRVMGEAA